MGLCQVVLVGQLIIGFIGVTGLVVPSPLELGLERLLDLLGLSHWSASGLLCERALSRA